MNGAFKPGRLALFLLLCLVLLVSAYFTFSYANEKITRGLDIAGGLYVLLEAEETGDREVDQDNVARAITIINSRVDELGVAEPAITPQGRNRIRIELPELDDVERAREIIGRTARLSFVGPDGEEVVTGEHLRRATMERDLTGHDIHPYIALEFNDEGAMLFAEATAKFLNQEITIILDDEVISSPVVQSVITGGQATIQGNFTSEEAQDLALMLRSGSLPVTLNELESRLIGPTLGEQTEEISKYAALIGVAAVILFMIIYYRVAGFVAGVALVFYLTMVLGALSVLPTTLTLPGMAGLILSIGMAVDANVIIFERIKDELRSGRTIRNAVEGGFQRAFRTILDANVTTIIGTIVLFALASGPVRGFAVTLFIGIVCSMITAILLTRFLMRLANWAGILRSGSYLGVKVS